MAPPTSCGPTRDRALLIADASPALWGGTEVMTAVVSGATRMHRPMPRITDAGKISIQYEAGGRKLAGWSGRRTHAWLVTGMRANHRMPTAMMAGPAAMTHGGQGRPPEPPTRA